jgi:hypothetical protein
MSLCDSSFDSSSDDSLDSFSSIYSPSDSSFIAWAPRRLYADEIYTDFSGFVHFILKDFKLPNERIAHKL